MSSEVGDRASEELRAGRALFVGQDLGDEPGAGSQSDLRSRIDTNMVNGIQTKMQSDVAATLAASAGVQVQSFP